MAKSNLDAVVGRAMRDQQFRSRLRTDSKAIAQEYSLAPDELATLEKFSQSEIDSFFTNVVGGMSTAVVGGTYTTTTTRIMFCSDKSCYESG